MAVVEIKLDRLKIHPRNIRKEYEGIDELAQSIRENGIMQNLTVVPDPEEKEKYLVVIGNRRLIAAREAGIETAPCLVVEDMGERDQITTMLTENMNRKDLKIYEESAALQMCFADFGIGIDELEQKTGLSKTTINRRLNVAKLDEDVLKEKAQDSGFQLNLTDLYELEKVESIEARNRILKEARDSADLAEKAKNEARREMYERNKKILIELCKKKGIEEAPESAKHDYYYAGKWESVARYRLDEKMDQIEIDEKEETEKLFYLTFYSELIILKKAKKKKRELADYEIERKAIEKKRNELNEKSKLVFENMRNFALEIFDGKTKPIKDEKKLKKIDSTIWNLLMIDEGYIGMSDIQEFLLGKERWNPSVTQQERDEAKKKAKKLDILYQKVACALMTLKDLVIADWNGTYYEKNGKKFKICYDILKSYGYSWLDEESEQIANGTHELYEVEKE